MKNMKKFLSLGLATVMAFSMVACAYQPVSTPEPAAAEAEPQAAEPAQEKTDAAPEAPSEEVTVTFWNAFTGADGDMLVDLVNRYNQENTDGVKVEMDISADFDSQLSTAFAAGTGPTMILSSSAARFTYGDHLQDVSDAFTSGGLNKEDFIKSYLDYCSEGDKLYFVPFQIVGYYMYWNKDLFEAAGLDPEKGPATWDEWKEYASKITDESKNVYGSGISYGYAFQIAHIIQRFGGLAVTDDNGTWKANFDGNKGYAEFLGMYKDMIDNGDNPLEAETDPMASAGQIGMTIGGPWVTAGLDTAGINYGIGLIPQGPAGDMNSVEVLGFAITDAASDAEKQAAYKFINWWNTENSQGSSPALEWSLANGFPAYTYSVQAKDEYKASTKLNAMSAANPDAPTDFICDSSFAGVNPIITDVISQLINAVAFGDDIDSSLTKAQESADKIVADYNK